MLKAACFNSANEHVYGNALEHLQNCGNLDMINSMTVPEKMTYIFSRELSDSLYCTLHGKMCPVPHCEIDSSGFPCVDWSPAGYQLGIFGRSFPVLLALLNYYRRRRIPVVFLENVPEFCVEVLHALAGDLYSIYPFYTAPCDVGCEFLSRTRLFVMMLLKG